jgi:hypothetical protein
MLLLFVLARSRDHWRLLRLRCAVHKISCRQIVCANESIGAIFPQYGLDELRIAGVSDPDQVAPSPLAL